MDKNKYVIDKMKSHIATELQTALQTSIKDKMREIHHSKVKSVVYDKYNPLMYKRRMSNGGLLDDDNFVVEVQMPLFTSSNMSVTGKYMNITKPSASIHPNRLLRRQYSIQYRNTQYKTALAYWIENGGIYRFPWIKRAAYHSPRPFVAETMIAAKEVLFSTTGIATMAVKTAISKAISFVGK